MQRGLILTTATMQSVPKLICDSTTAVTNEAGQPVLCVPQGWRGLRLTHNVIPAAAETGPACVQSAMLMLAIRGTGRRWYRFGAKTIELSTRPGMLELYSGDFERDSARWAGQNGQTVGVYIDPIDVARLLPEADDLSVRTTHELFDPKFQWLVQELFDEAERGAPSGALYVEGLSSALLGRLAEFYAVKRSPKTSVGHLSYASRRVVLDYIDTHLGDDISVIDLALEARLSPHHFSRAFKATLGASPHQYVIRRRMEAATKLITTSSMPIVEIALALGFSSQSHFTQAFRRYAGTTPADARKP